LISRFISIALDYNYYIPELIVGWYTFHTTVASLGVMTTLTILYY